MTADGTEAAGNGLAGVYVDGVPGTRVGGTKRGQGNVVSANGEYGVYVAQADGTSVLGNRIGVGADGALALGNGGAGIRLVRSTRATTIGGVEPGAGNVIAHNGGAGVDVDFGIDVTILSNAIFDNGRVDAGLANGITMNVNAMEPPVLTSVTPGAGETTVTGGIRAVWAAPGTTRIEFFHDGGCDENGSGEGETLVGAIDVERDASGFAAFTISLPVSLGPGEAITATATSADGTTSPFSHCSPASSGCILPLLTNVPPFYVSLRPGESTTLTAAASGSVPFSFQWSQVAIGGSSPIPGATSSSFDSSRATFVVDAARRAIRAASS